MATRTVCKYLNLTLGSPVIVGACPLTLEPEKLRQMLDAGVGAVVLPSLFQEQLSPQGGLPLDPLAAAELAGRDLRQQIYNGGPDHYLGGLQQIKRMSTVPVCASLSGYSPGPWLDFAKSLAAGGADALELNLQPVISGPEPSAGEIEAEIASIVQGVCSLVKIPVAVKLSRHFTNVAHMVHRIRSAGAAGVVLFAHETHWDVALDRMQWTPRWELTPVDSVGSTIAGVVQGKLGAVDCSVAASGGIRTADDALKALIAGADAVMITSEIYRSGPAAIGRIVQGVERYLETHGFASLHEFQQARPRPQPRTQRLQRQAGYLDPLTASTNYHDPSPVMEMNTGDRYGHRD